jgi:DNA polymerase family A
MPPVIVNRPCGDVPNTVVLLDFETYYSPEYSLSKMETLDYVQDPRFEIIGMGIKVGKGPKMWLTDVHDMNMMLAGIDWPNVAVAGHNLYFDGAILQHRLGIRPAMWLDTLSMARAMIKPFTGSVSLGACLKWLAAEKPEWPVPVKGDAAVKAIGMHKSDFSTSLLRNYGDYCMDDVAGTGFLLAYMLPHFSLSELKLIDRTIRMYIEPTLNLNPLILRQHLDEEKERKLALLDEASIDKATIMSNDKFADRLRLLGVEPPTKISPTTGKPTYALSKKDLDFVELQEHPNPDVQAIVAARLGVKTTIAETRAEKLLNVAITRGIVPIQLNYFGAHSGRYSSSGPAGNWQNLPGGSPIRRAMEAPKGYVVMAADARQIEARVMACVARQMDKVQQFADGVDVYSKTASGLYGVTVTAETHPKERKIGKVADLSLQYGAGAPTFYTMGRNGGVQFDMDEAQRVVRTWRRINSDIAALWPDLHDLFRYAFTQRKSGSWDFRGRAEIGYDAHRAAGFMRMPNGLIVWYANPGYGTDKKGRQGFGYVIREGRSERFELLRPTTSANNLIQTLARCATMEQAVILSDYASLRLVLTVHDELVFLVPEQMIDRAARACNYVMSQAPAWAPDFPLATEVKIGKNYGDKKEYVFA